MRLVPKVLVLAIASALAASMGATARSPDPSVKPDEPTLMPEALQSSGWRLVSIGDRVVPGERELTLFLRGSDGDGEASGRSACRSYRTTFEADGDTVAFGAPTIDGAGDCADSLLGLDGAYLEALTSMTDWRLEEGAPSGPVLRLSGTTGNSELTFQPSDSPSVVAPCPVMADAEVNVPAEPGVDEAGGLIVMEPTLELCPSPHQSFRTIIDAGVGRVRAKSIPRLSDWDRSYIKDRCTAGTSVSRLQNDPMRLRSASARAQRRLGCLVLLTEAWNRYLEQPVEMSTEPSYEAASRIYQYAAKEFGPKLRKRYAHALLAYEAARLTEPRTKRARKKFGQLVSAPRRPVDLASLHRSFNAAVTANLGALILPGDPWERLSLGTFSYASPFSHASDDKSTAFDLVSKCEVVITSATDWGSTSHGRHECEEAIANTWAMYQVTGDPRFYSVARGIRDLYLLGSGADKKLRQARHYITPGATNFGFQPGRRLHAWVNRPDPDGYPEVPWVQWSRDAEG